MAFHLHERLAADTYFVMDLMLSQLRLMNDSRFPWLILVPRREGIRDIHNLSEQDQAHLLSEITEVSKTLEAQVQAEKMNVAALGNMVPQLHVHIIARFSHDAAWPGPVWGSGAPVPYGDDVENVVKPLQQSLEPT